MTFYYVLISIQKHVNNFPKDVGLISLYIECGNYKEIWTKNPWKKMYIFALIWLADCYVVQSASEQYSLKYRKRGVFHYIVTTFLVNKVLVFLQEILFDKKKRHKIE